MVLLSRNCLLFVDPVRLLSVIPKGCPIQTVPSKTEDLEEEQQEPGLQGLDTVRTLAFLPFLICAPLSMLAPFFSSVRPKLQSHKT